MSKNNDFEVPSCIPAGQSFVSLAGPTLDYTVTNMALADLIDNIEEWLAQQGVTESGFFTNEFGDKTGFPKNSKGTKTRVPNGWIVDEELAVMLKLRYHL